MFKKFVVVALLLVGLLVLAPTVGAQETIYVATRNAPLIEVPFSQWPINELEEVARLTTEEADWVLVNHPRWGEVYVLMQEWVTRSAEYQAWLNEQGDASEISCEFGPRQEATDMNTVMFAEGYNSLHMAWGPTQAPYSNRTVAAISVLGVQAGDVVMVNGVVSPLPEDFVEVEHTRQYVFVVESNTGVAFEPGQFDLAYFHNVDVWRGSACEDTLAFVMNYAATEPGLPGPEAERSPGQ